MEQHLKVICLDGLFHPAVDQLQNKRYKIFKLYDPSQQLQMKPTPAHSMFQVQGSNFSHKLLITQLHLSQANCHPTERLLQSVQKHLHLFSQAQTSAI